MKARMSANKIALIIQREYISRVKKKSFVVMTILGPIVGALLFIAPLYFSQVNDQVYNIAVVDESGLFSNLPETENMKFQYLNTSLSQAKKEFQDSENYSILYIPLTAINSSKGIMLFSEKQPGLQAVMYLENCISKQIEKAKLSASGIDPKLLASTRSNVKINTVKLTENGEKDNNTELAIKISFAGGLLIYIFIFLYGAQVMRGVIEEKTSRIVEVIISSVRPFQLMMGKIIGIALVSLTQFLLWVVFTTLLTTIASKVVSDKYAAEKIMAQSQNTEVTKSLVNPQVLEDVFQSFGDINFPVIMGIFFFYFIGGYLLYGAFFAAIGSAVDSESDTQQFMLPLTLPLILSFMMSQIIINNPEGQLAFWFSIIPFTSPVIMMMRIPFGVPVSEIILSMALLSAGFIFATWMAAKIYRTGILMYGKKVSYKEIGKWLFYKE